MFEKLITKVKTINPEVLKKGGIIVGATVATLLVAAVIQRAASQYTELGELENLTELGESESV